MSRKIMRVITLFALFTLLFLMVGCDTTNGDTPLVQVIPPSAPDAGFVDYQHPSNVFSIRIPPGWVYNDLPDDNGLRVEFSTLEGEESVVRLTVYVVNTGTPLTREAFLQTVNAYAPPQDFANYNWHQLQDPVDQSDTSRRVVGVREYPIIGPRVLNIFMQSDGAYFSALEVDVSEATPDTLRTLQAVVNTYQVDDNVIINQGEVAGGVVYTGNIGFEAYNHWSDANGAFNITGLVVNNQDVPVEAVRLSAYLFNARGNQLAEEAIILSKDVLFPNERAPFRITFEGGRPSSALRYELHVAARVADFSLSNFYDNDNYESQYVSEFNENGNLVVTGQIRNIGTRLVRNTKLIITVFDNNGNVTAAETQFINTDQLIPNEVAGFEVTIYDLGSEPRSVEVMVVGTAE